jgi:hypothetical protein
MPNSVAGQSFDIVTCQSCENDLSFQKALPAKRVASAPGELEITCRICGHLGSYSPAHIRQAQAQYPL